MVAQDGRMTAFPTWLDQNCVGQPIMCYGPTGVSGTDANGEKSLQDAATLLVTEDPLFVEP